MLAKFFDVIKAKNPKYKNNLSIIQDAIMKGLEIVKDEVDSCSNK